MSPLFLFTGAPTTDFYPLSLHDALPICNTLSDEFVEVLLGKLMELLRPNPFDLLQEATLNAALAHIRTIHPRTAITARMAMQTVATDLSGIRYLRQSQHHMDESFIEIYG